MDWNTLAQAVNAVATAITAFLVYRTHRKVEIVQKDVATVEKATNNMKDVLVDSTAKAAHAEGELKGRQDVRDELNSRSVK